ncbi:MAG: DUF4142 domain-containing protein [Burkholderiales bacterium]|nr:DUF4142 domain-containing protein [Burkholderiales bacterium]
MTAALHTRSAVLAAVVAATCLLAACDRNPKMATNDPKEDGAVAMGAGTDGTGVTSTGNPGGLAVADAGRDTATGMGAGDSSAANRTASGSVANDPALSGSAGPGGAGLVGSSRTAGGITTNGNGVALNSGSNSANPSGDALDRLPATAAGAQPGAAGSATGAASLAIADRNFLAHAAEGGLFEVEAGRLASERAQHTGVKALGATLSSDHTDAAQRLRDLAAAKGVTLPTTVSAAQRETLTKLGQASGADFDRLFLAQVGIDAHQRDIAAFEHAAREAKDADVKAFATATLPTLRQHLATARRLSGAAGH